MQASATAEDDAQQASSARDAGQDDADNQPAADDQRRRSSPARARARRRPRTCRRRCRRSSSRAQANRMLEHHRRTAPRDAPSRMLVAQSVSRSSPASARPRRGPTSSTSCAWSTTTVRLLHTSTQHATAHRADAHRHSPVLGSCRCNGGEQPTFEFLIPPQVCAYSFPSRWQVPASVIDALHLEHRSRPCLLTRALSRSSRASSRATACRSCRCGVHAVIRDSPTSY